MGTLRIPGLSHVIVRDHLQRVCFLSEGCRIIDVDPPSMLTTAHTLQFRVKNNMFWTSDYDIFYQRESDGLLVRESRDNIPAGDYFDRGVKVFNPPLKDRSLRILDVFLPSDKRAFVCYDGSELNYHEIDDQDNIVAKSWREMIKNMDDLNGFQWVQSQVLESSLVAIYRPVNEFEDSGQVVFVVFLIPSKVSVVNQEEESKAL